MILLEKNKWGQNLVRFNDRWERRLVKASRRAHSEDTFMLAKRCSGFQPKSPKFRLIQRKSLTTVNFQKHTSLFPPQILLHDMSLQSSSWKVTRIYIPQQGWWILDEYRALQMSRGRNTVHSPTCPWPPGANLDLLRTQLRSAAIVWLISQKYGRGLVWVEG